MDDGSVWFSGDDGALYVMGADGIAARQDFRPDPLVPSGDWLVYDATQDAWLPLPHQKD